MKEVAWVVGASAAGKETFIKKVHGNPELLLSLGWAGRPLTFSEASIKNIGQYKNDPVLRKRKRILVEVPALLRDADVVLIKWQIADTKALRPQRLKQLLPSVRHTLIELTAPQDELAKRIKQKPWWNNDGTEIQFIAKELGIVARSIKQLGEDFENATLTSTANTYSIVNK